MKKLRSCKPFRRSRRGETSELGMRGRRERAFAAITRENQPPELPEPPPAVAVATSTPPVMTVERISTNTLTGADRLALGDAADGILRRGDLRHLLVQQPVAGRVLIDAHQIAQLEGVAGAVEFEHAGGGDADRIGVARAAALHGHSQELAGEELLVGGDAPLVGLRRGGFGVVHVEVNQVADLNGRRAVDRRNHGIGVAVSPSHYVCHVESSEEKVDGHLSETGGSGY